MKINILRYLTIISLLLLLGACRKEQPAGPTPQPATTLRYSATVSEGDGTRATVSDGKYVFEAGDKLYVIDGSGDIHGVLELTAGDGQTTATFAGDLICEGDRYPLENTQLNAVLVSANDVLHTVSDGKVTGRTYPTDAFGSDFADAVSKYSDFTATSTYGAHSFSLSQQSSFLICNIGVEGDTDFDVTLTNGTDVRSATVTPLVQQGTKIVRVAAAYPGGTALSGAMLTIGSRVETISNATLQANCYYYVNRPLAPFTGFTIRAISNDTEITFNSFFVSTSKEKVQYSLTQGLFWEDLTNKNLRIILQAGQTICVRGTRPAYNAYKDGNYPFFTATTLCYIGGNIMSLTSPDETYSTYNDYIRDNAFNSLFRNASLIDIDQDNMLLLPATDFRDVGEKKNYYKNMFNGCTSLTVAPALPATTLRQGCYEGMFRGCTGLTTAPDLPAPVLTKDCYKDMFNGCTSLNYVKCLAVSNIDKDNSTANWLINVSSTGTFVQDPNAKWGARGPSRIPNGWAVEDAN